MFTSAGNSFLLLHRILSAFEVRFFVQERFRTRINRRFRQTSRTISGLSQ
ncbi:unnamed protein product [Amoebophrya sp. A120]|nr:unnamed protein product [Amoebophrya sp. A120]|eukprot:GSA120T00021232001.1